MGEALAVKIAFGRSTSQYFRSAVRAAAALPGYRREGDGRDEEHVVETSVDLDDGERWASVERLISLINGWRTARIETPGFEWSHVLHLAIDLDKVRRCRREQRASGLDEDFCLDKRSAVDDPKNLGCRHLPGPKVRPLSHEVGWWEFGELVGTEAFKVDKPRLLRVIRGQSSRSACRYCPAFSWPLVERRLGELPNLVTLDDESAFTLSYSPGDRSKPVGISRRPAPPLILIPAPRPVVPAPAPTAPATQPMPKAAPPAGAHDTEGGTCRRCGRTADEFTAPCGRPELGRMGFIELD